jgi:hypothetical protein
VLCLPPEATQGEDVAGDRELHTGGPRRGLPERSGASLRALLREGTTRPALAAAASPFHADGPNDVAPGGYNLDTPAADLPRSPLAAEPAPTGFRSSDQ